MPTKRSAIKIRTILIGLLVLVFSIFLAVLLLYLIFGSPGVHLGPSVRSFWVFVLGMFLGAFLIRFFITKRNTDAIIIYSIFFAFFIFYLIIVAINILFGGARSVIPFLIVMGLLYLLFALLSSFLGYKLAQGVEKIFRK